ncbi:dystonin isoform X30 [Brachionus plicatilis]|uniref:Dystonin isoform X30 n=1 Tax=Brachionus plicatilis TaxID=10195 RepID=A0A3M7RPN1_BRAPC|nr:dystonin isoform X30 [Brachionus plicatilis]
MKNYMSKKLFKISSLENLIKSEQNQPLNNANEAVNQSENVESKVNNSNQSIYDLEENSKILDINKMTNKTLDLSLNCMNYSYSFDIDDSELFNRFDRNKLQIDNKDWLSEKPISILQLDSADRAVLKIADQRDKIQTKTFTKWINQHLKKISIQINDLFSDLRNGINLILLLELLTDTKIKKDFGLMRFHWLENVENCLKFLTAHNIKIVNIRPDEIVDGNPKLTLGLIWIIILHFQISEVILANTTNNESVVKNTLMSWVNKNLEHFPNLKVTDFTKSWKDGRALLILIQQYIPEHLIAETICENTNRDNLKLAFDLAESYFKVPKLLDPEDVDSDIVDERSIMTYLSSLYLSLARLKCSSETISELPNQFHEYRSTELFSLNKWIDEKIEFLEKNDHFPNELIDLRTQIEDLNIFYSSDSKSNDKELMKVKSVISELKQIELDQNNSHDEQSYQELVNKWENLKNLIENKKSQLDKANLEFEKTKKNFININNELNNLEMSLQKIDSTISAFTINNENKYQSIVNGDWIQLEKIENTIFDCEKQIRKFSLDIDMLQKDNFPNSDFLAKRIKKLEHMTYNILVDYKTKKAEFESDLNSLCLNHPEASQVDLKNRENFDHSNKLINRSIKIIESTFILSLSSNLEPKKNNQRELAAISACKVLPSNLNQLVDDAFEWIENLNKEISNFDFENNVYDKVNHRMEEITNDVKIFHDSLEAINLIEHSDSVDLKSKTDKIFCQFNALCKKLKISTETLELFAHFLKSFKQEMKELNTIENEELNRDWSVPSKQNIVELEKYRNQLCSKINLRKKNIKQITQMASKLIELNHPACESIENKTKTLLSEIEWTEKLLILFDIHLKNLELYSKFNLSYIELWSNLEMIDDQKSDPFLIEQMEQQIGALNEILMQLPSFRIRKMRIVDPLPNAILLVDYKTIYTSFSKGEHFRILNNSNYLRWNIYSISQDSEDFIPSVCFIIPGPDKELKKIADNCKQKLVNFKNRMNVQHAKKITVKQPNEFENSENKLLNELDEKLTKMLESTDNKIKILDGICLKSNPPISIPLEIMDLNIILNSLIDKFAQLSKCELFIIDYSLNDQSNHETEKKCVLRKNCYLINKFQVNF